MTFFVVTCFFAWVFEVSSVPTTHEDPNYHDPTNLVNSVQSKEAVTLIAGLVPAYPNEFPYQVSLQARDNGKWRHICSGAVVAEDKVVTAGHCIYHSEPAYLRVVAGEHNLTRTEDTEQISGIHAAIYHPKYDSRTLDYDYGVLRLSRNLTFNKYVLAIPLAADDFQWSGNCLSNGWGNICGNGSWIISDVLYKQRLPILPRTICSELYQGVGRVTERMICAGAEGYGSYHGDGGGPLVCNGILTGILSWGQFGCEKGQLPTVFASVAAEQAWILSQ